MQRTRTIRAISWLTAAALLVPQAALAAVPRAVTASALHERLSEAAMRSAWGGSMSAGTAHLGENTQHGFITVKRELAGGPVCGPPEGSSKLVVPTGFGGGGHFPSCNDSIPRHSLSDLGVRLLIGGEAVNLNGGSDPTMHVIVNGAEVPAGQLGGLFVSRCPRDTSATGTAVIADATFLIYSCDPTDLGWENEAVIPMSYFQVGLNTISVMYTFAEGANGPGEEIQTRIVSMTL